MNVCFAFTSFSESNLCHSVCSVYGVYYMAIFIGKPSTSVLPQLQTCVYIHNFFTVHAYIEIQFIVCTCLFACPCMGKWVCPSFCLRCWPRPQVHHDPNNIFPEPCFHWVSWAITVIAIIMWIVLTLVPLCSRKGLTLSAIYADWLDRPGIPKVWGVWLFSAFSLFFLSL